MLSALLGQLLLESGPVFAAGGLVCASIAEPPLPTGIAAKRVGGPLGRVPSQGQVSVLVVFAQFKGEAPHSSEVPSYARRLFSPDVPGSFTHFYNTMSQGQLQVRGTVLLRRYTSEQPPRAYLAKGPSESGGYGDFVREILTQVDDEIDLRQFDNDGPDGIPNSGDDDGMVDYTFVNLRSVPRGFLRGGATGIAGLGLREPFLTQDVGVGGKPIQFATTRSRGSIQEEGSFSQTVGTMAHEFGHSLGLPDLFDQSFLFESGQGPVEDSAGIGAWGLMGWGAHGWNGHDGPNPLCAWSLERLGWIGWDNDRLVEVPGDAADLVIEDLYQGGSAYKIHLATERLNGVESWGEYLLLEKRTRSATYYDRNLPGEGVLVWHVRRGAWTNQSERDKLVDLVCADGLYADAGYPLGRHADPVYGADNLDFWAHDALYRAQHGGNKGDVTDPFDGVRFTDLDLSSNPGNNPQGRVSAASTGVSLNLRRRGVDVVMDVRQPRWAGTSGRRRTGAALSS
jgi:M6 family metalloprotease-like protein